MENYYPNSWIAYRILLTIPISIASGEIRFSKLKMIKNYLRSTILQEILNELAMLSIKNNFVGKLDYASLIDVFVSKNTRAMFKWYLLVNAMLGTLCDFDIQIVVNFFCLGQFVYLK